METDLVCDLLEKERALWDIKCPLYAKKEEREKALGRLAAAAGLSVLDAKKRIRHLRLYFAENLRKCKRAQLGRAGGLGGGVGGGGGATGDSLNQPKWKYFHRLMFLKDSVEQRKASYMEVHQMIPQPVSQSVTINPRFLSAPEEKEEAHELEKIPEGNPFSPEDTHPFLQASLSPPQQTTSCGSYRRSSSSSIWRSPRTKPKKIKTEVVDDFARIAPIPQDPLEDHERPPPEPVPDDSANLAFGRHVAMSLDRLDLATQEYAKLKIQQALYECFVHKNPPDMGVPQVYSSMPLSHLSPSISIHSHPISEHPMSPRSVGGQSESSSPTGH
ncbi:uncharacterized protein LOC143021081 [Oratosquilla oratoria]|uniref:uncharacterized protein LOC143021081 n=1 Tax=Oratosquilla oratoria TaxID=337810 RepID=UPI003F767B12